MFTRRTVSRDLEALRQRVDAWRKQQGRRSFIPDDLWEEAVKVAAIDGVWATARATRFNYQKLQEKVREEGARGVFRVQAPAVTPNGTGEESSLRVTGGVHGDSHQVASKASGKTRACVAGTNSAAGAGHETFIEVAMSAIGGGGRTVVEFLGRHGDRMRVDVAGGVDVVGLAQAFWRRGEP